MSSNSDINVNQIVIELIPSKRSKDSANSAFLESSPFIFQSSECYLRISFGWENNESRMCKAYIKSHPTLSPKFYVTPYVFKGSNSISYPKRLVLDPIKFIWSTPLCDITKRLPGADKWNLSFRFVFQTDADSNYDPKTSGHRSGHAYNDSLKILSDDFSRLLDGDTKYDIELKTGDFVIKAHKTVLRARSKYFERALETLTEDRTSTPLELPYIDPHTCSEIMRYIYTGKDPDFSWETAKKIYKAGEISNTGSLKQRCEDFLIESLTLDNACELLALVEEDDTFKERVTGYVLEKEIPFLDEYWKPFCDDHPKSANDVYHKLVRILRQRRE